MSGREIGRETERDTEREYESYNLTVNDRFDDLEMSDRIANFVETMYSDYKSLHETVNQLQTVMDSSVSRTRYEFVLQSHDKNKRLLDSIKTSLETLVCTLQSDTQINFLARNRYKTILNHIVDMIKNN